MQKSDDLELLAELCNAINDMELKDPSSNLSFYLSASQQRLRKAGYVQNSIDGSWMLINSY